MTFDLSSSITIDELKIYSISIHITEHEKTNFTIILIYITDEIKLSSFVIFKFKNILKCNFSLEVIIRANLTKWINENKMLY